MIHLELQPEIEAQLAAEAKSHGIPTERYIESILSQHIELRPSAENGGAKDLTVLTDEEDEAIRQGWEDVNAGRTRPLDEVFDEMRARYAIPR